MQGGQKGRECEKTIGLVFDQDRRKRGRRRRRKRGCETRKKKRKGEPVAAADW